MHVFGLPGSSLMLLSTVVQPRPQREANDAIQYMDDLVPFDSTPIDAEPSARNSLETHLPCRTCFLSSGYIYNQKCVATVLRNLVFSITRNHVLNINLKQFQPVKVHKYGRQMQDLANIKN